jgi:hypothetical protein
LKDRSWALNGRLFRWGDKPRYEPGGYRTVWEDIEPHFDAVQLTQEHAQLEEGSSEDAIQDDGRGDYYHRARMKQACFEDWDAAMELIFPGTAAVMKRNRALIGEAITGVRSRTRLEQYDVAQLQQCVGVLMAFERGIKAEPVIEEQSMLELLKLAKEDFRGSTQKDTSLLEVLLHKSVEQAEANGGTPEQKTAPVPF